MAKVEQVCRRASSLGCGALVSTPGSDKDVGRGLPKGGIDALLNAFGTSSSGGVGIDLSISRTIIEAHGGQLWATAGDPVGATISFELPTRPAIH